MLVAAARESIDRCVDVQADSQRYLSGQYLEDGGNAVVDVLDDIDQAYPWMYPESKHSLLELQNIIMDCIHIAAVNCSTGVLFEGSPSR